MARLYYMYRVCVLIIHARLQLGSNTPEPSSHYHVHAVTLPLPPRACFTDTLIEMSAPLRLIWLIETDIKACYSDIFTSLTGIFYYSYASAALIIFPLQSDNAKTCYTAGHFPCVTHTPLSVSASRFTVRR